MTSKLKVLVTGASGLIGGITIHALSHKYEFSALNRRLTEEIPCTQADITDFNAMTPAFHGIDVVLHLSAYTANVNEWESTRDVNIDGTYNVYEASRLNGVNRVVFASTGSTMLGYEHDTPYGDLAEGNYASAPDNWPMIAHTWPVRPDSLYGVSKVFGEALGRHYSDYYGISVINIRLGAVLDTDRPKLRRHYPGYLSQSDCVQMIDLCLNAPASVRYDTFVAISNNRWKWRDTSHATEVLGRNPEGNSDDLEIA